MGGIYIFSFPYEDWRLIDTQFIQLATQLEHLQIRMEIYDPVFGKF
jgi:hypothetical protein